ncbi:MAG: methylenetetrahydrofolate reductase [Gammaproteobacteria bacterium]|nr:methylenetetrahydrofolate reductase [Gammaproteobacteria bacterium]
MTAGTHAAQSVCTLLDRWSIEMTAKDVPHLEEAADLIPKGTKIPVTFLPGETFEMRIAAAKRVRDLGFLPIPHISARRLQSQQELEGFLAGIQQEVGTDHAFVVAGDPPEPMGPYEDALSIIRSGLLAQYGIKRVGISGYPEGHPDIGNDKLWKASLDKQTEILERGHDFAVVTQFAFDADPVLKWLEELRKNGIQALVRVGVPGPATVKRLLSFAARCGVTASTKVMKKYGLSLTKLLSTAGPDQLIEEYARRLDPARHGDVLMHLYPFGGLRATAEWVRDFRARNGCS